MSAATAAADAIVAVEARDHAVALERPLQIGPMTVTERCFASVHVRTESGRCGVAIAQTRGAPVATIVADLFAPVLDGHDALAVRARWDDLFRATVATGRSGLVIRALSLVDVALWDLLGQAAGLPLHRLLGGFRERLPVTFVAGTAARAEEVDGVVSAAVAAADAGHATVKIARPPGAEPARALIAALDAALPPQARLAVDANWAWASPAEALAELRTWPAERIAWIEDPLLPERPEQLRALRAETAIPVAAGDEVTDPGTVRRLLDGAVDVLRLDVLTIGGITAALPLLEEAARNAIPVSFHISPETSLQLACGLPGAADVETFDRAGNRFDPAHELIDGGPVFSGGFAVPSQRPGVGFALRPAG